MELKDYLKVSHFKDTVGVKDYTAGVHALWPPEMFLSSCIYIGKTLLLLKNSI
jgi:hypothetical protein